MELFHRGWVCFFRQQKSKMNWYMEVLFQGLHNCNMKTNSPYSPLLHLFFSYPHKHTHYECVHACTQALPCIDHPHSLAWKAIQFIADWQARHCVVVFSKSKLVMWTKDGSPINSVCRGFRELSPPHIRFPPHHIKVSKVVGMYSYSSVSRSSANNVEFCPQKSWFTGPFILLNDPSIFTLYTPKCAASGIKAWI